MLDGEGQTVGILSKTDFLKTVTRKLILVDHNELSQAVQGADEVEIIEIIDHHRIGTLATQQPILFRNEPVGSSCTIVADCFFRHGVELPRAHCRAAAGRPGFRHAEPDLADDDRRATRKF